MPVVSNVEFTVHVILQNKLKFRAGAIDDFVARSLKTMRNLEGNTHLSPISLYTKSTFPGLLLNRRSSCH